MKFNTLVENVLNGLAKGQTIENLATKHNVSLEELQSELNTGLEVEREHTQDEETAKTIAMDHLFEDPKYYTKLKRVEKTS
ncbi:MAG: hypothetical protein EBU90_00895 [Proteobacteria bacterium]|nr:hypothetical protein [Pseudomonadota bacterium]NBP12990.1 hypothetical protein [bacterium]